MTDIATPQEGLDMEITELADGSAVVETPAEATPAGDSAGFYDNLAAGKLSKFQLGELAGTLIDLIKQDKKARERRDEQYEEGIRRTGLGDDAPGGASFSGASKVVHPILAEGCVDYAARAIREIFPSDGPVKTKIVGDADAKKLDKARRKRDCLNWQLTHEILEYRPEKENLLTQLPLGGSQYEKYWFDPKLGRIRMEFVPIDKVLLPFAATSFYTTPRMAHMQDLTDDEWNDRIRSGFYVGSADGAPEDVEQTASGQASDKVEGRDAGDNPDGLRLVYEISYRADLEGTGSPAPYVVHLDDSSQQVVAVYRNWAESDSLKLKLDWWVENKFIPWRGAYGIGLPHLIGGMAAALTGALRALLDSAHINNSPGAVKLKGGRSSGQNTEIAQTEVKEIDAPAGTDDIRKVIMPMPFNPPSTVLYQLLDWLTGQAKGVVATTEERMGQIGDRTPVGTTMAMIEQGSATYSAIHARLHEAQRHALRIICRLNATYPSPCLERFGLSPQDFLDTDDIEPVSDPHIFSEAQRYAQLQEQIKLLQVFPQERWNTNELARRALHLLRVDGVDSILPKPPEPVTADPISENVALMRGAPLKAAQEQDHEAHIQAHLTFVLNPLNVADPSPMPQLAGLMAHVREHLTMLYEHLCMTALPVLRAQGAQGSPDQLAVAASNMAAQQVGSIAQQLGPLLQQAGQVVQQKSPAPPIDPAVQKTFEAAMAEIERKKTADAERLKFDQQKQQAADAMAVQQAQLDERLAQIEGQNKANLEMTRLMYEKHADEIRQQVELLKNKQDNEVHQITELLKNRDDNATQLMIAQLKEQLTAAQPAPQSDNDAMLKQMQQMLAELEKARTNDALSAVTEGLRTMIQSQQEHQTRTMQMAASLMRGSE